MKKRILTLALAFLMLMALSLPALADTGYTGEINPETGDPYGEDSAQDTGDRVPLSSGMYYDWITHDYAYPIPDSLGEVHVSAADGMVLTTSVSIDPGSDASVTVFLNGSEYTGSLENCKSVGEYVISALVGGSTRRLMSFTIVGKSTCNLYTFVVPDGFYIRDAQRNGESVYLDRYSVDMEKEGEYLIEYECSATNLVYKLETAIDRTPPGLTFQAKMDSQGRVRSQLDFQGLDEGDSIYLSRSGEAVELEVENGGGTVYDPGNYAMIVTDAAGNSVEYDFIILQYLNLTSWAFFLLVFVVICAVVMYIILKRKRLKIG